jgi:hypothetical protein
VVDLAGPIRVAREAVIQRVRSSRCAPGATRAACEGSAGTLGFRFLSRVLACLFLHPQSIAHAHDFSGPVR